MSKSILIKGTADGLLVSLPDGDWNQIKQQLLDMIENRSEFFKGAQMALQVGEIDLGASELGSLRDLLFERSVDLRAVLSTSDATRAAAANLGLRLELKEADTKPTSTGGAMDGEEAIFLARTIRSGHSIHFPGHVTILGDVNPGAEIIAGGNIVVWGRLRGTVHAGASGDESCMICALDLAPTQLRIAGHIAISPTKKGRQQPEIAIVRQDQIVAETWSVEERIRGL
ncbi:MAG: septum site-determining protein MinC [Anaerolineales bacterium]|jgi:septum site-determining protein MinC